MAFYMVLFLSSTEDVGSFYFEYGMLYGYHQLHPVSGATQLVS